MNDEETIVLLREILLLLAAIFLYERDFDFILIDGPAPSSDENVAQPHSRANDHTLPHNWHHSCTSRSRRD